MVICAIIEGRNDKAAPVSHHQTRPLTSMKGDFTMATSDRTNSSIQIQLTRGYTTVVDVVDADLALTRWAMQPSGAHRKVPVATGRVGIGNQQRRVLLHRLIMSRLIGRDLKQGEMVDHIDGDTLNNRRSNLRIVNAIQNAQNRAVKPGTKSGLKGVSWDSRRKKWSAEIWVDKVKHFLGRFDDPVIAHQAYLKAAAEFFGEFCPTPERMRRE